RASSNKTFLNIKIGGSTLCISYQGKKTNNITDLRDFEFHAPRLELRNQVESYYELLMQVKKEYMSVVVQHTGALVKEKFRQLHNRKAWSKTSFGPDWEARRLLIDMDRRVDEDMAASIHGSSMSEREMFPEVLPTQQPTGAIAGHDALPVGLGNMEPLSSQEHHQQTRSRMPSISVSVASPRSTNAWAGESPAMASSSAAAAASGVESNDDTASIHSTKGKAPLSKYMILDPRKLMGKRIPNVLPRNFARGSESASVSRSHTPAQSVPSSGRFAQQSVGEGGSAPPTSPVSSVSSSFRPQLYTSMHLDMMSSSPTPSPRRNNASTREHRSPSIPPADENSNK
ncbi:Protein SABRE, partial [Coemansia sp. RSA 2703]